MDAAPAAPSRDYKVIGLIGAAHFLSHIYHLALPGLFPLIHRAEGYSFTELGFIASVFFVTSWLAQTPAGFLVDRIGARRLLIGGMLLVSASTTCIAFTDTYAVMLVLAFFAGLGNSVFHPADYSILIGSVSENRIGRAYGVHGFGGFVAYAATPAGIFALGSVIGWREALFCVGVAGMLMTSALWFQRAVLRDSGVDQNVASNRVLEEIGVLFRAPTVFAFLFFCFTAMGSVGLMTLGPSALIAFIEMAPGLANGTISLQLTGAVIGIVAGGFLVERVSRHDFVTAVVILSGSVMLLVVPVFAPRSAVIVIPIFVVFGFLYGMAQPARDMVVRSITPRGAAGKIFGFTYSGMDLGSAISASVFGILLDNGHPQMVFVLVAIFMVIGVSSILAAKMAARTREAAAPA
jgi:predicted MFS family arabinose efflux permease